MDNDNSPKFIHDCLHCVFLGHLQKHDLYYCPREKVLTARFDHDDLDCRVEVAEATSDPIMGEAFRRAKARGLIQEIEQDFFEFEERFGDW
jgi:hypothetical protein